jgi:cytochrome c-type biogenesis protein CcmH
VATSPKDVNTADAPAGTPHATNFDQIAAMTERLAVRMKEQPNDAEGWAMLARSYSVLGNHPDALKAYEKAVALRKDDATLLADYADALAVKNNRILGADSMKQVDRALKIDPRNLKALSLAGTYAFDRKDYAAAAKYWGQVVQFGPADNGIVQQIAPALAEARSLAGLPDVSPAQDLGAKATAVSGGNLTGTVTLASALLQKAQPDDTVFVFARAAEGSRMPLAIVRKQVRDLPFNFILDDTTSMSPANKLSAAKKVIVGARVSKSGNAMPQPGDLSGQTGPVDVGASGLKLEIKELVKP